MDILRSFLITLPTSKFLSYFWNLGSLLGFLLVFQLFTGFLLVLHYSADSFYAYESLQQITREVHLGWFVRLVQFNGASFIFFTLYFHLLNGFFVSSYRLGFVWFSGFILLLMIIAISFTGYVLAWSQMSYWACVVITSLVSVLPFFGDTLLLWVWGGYSVGTATLKLCFALHFLLPWLLVLVVLLHLLSLHSYGSSSPLGYSGVVGKGWFYPYFISKDILNLLVFLFFFVFMGLYPFMLGDPEMFVEANSLTSPAHIVPESYFLCYYGILRSIPSKGLGVFILLMSLLAPLSMLFLSNSLPPLAGFNRLLVWFFFSNFIILSWLGQAPVEPPYDTLGGISTFVYFGFLFMLSFNFLLSRLLFTL